MKVRIIVEKTFTKALKGLPPNRGKAANIAVIKFSQEPQTPSLKMRALQSNKGYFIINSVHGDRIILRKEADDLFAIVDVGPHDNVYRRWNRK